MKYCPNCGENIADDSLVSCSNCGYSFDTIINEEKPDTEEEPETGSKQVEEPDTGGSRLAGEYNASGEGSSAYINTDAYGRVTDEPELGNGIKVFLTALTMLVPAVGSLIGIVGGLVYMNREFQDYRSFGKALLVLGIVMFCLQFMGCCCAGLFSSL